MGTQTGEQNVCAWGEGLPSLWRFRESDSVRECHLGCQVCGLLYDACVFVCLRRENERGERIRGGARLKQWDRGGKWEREREREREREGERERELTTAPLVLTDLDTDKHF